MNQIEELAAALLPQESIRFLAATLVVTLRIHWTDALPQMADEGEGNKIVPNPPEQLGFPALALAALVVAAGIYVISEFDSKAGWILATLILLTIAFRYKRFGNQLTELLSPQSGAQQTTPQQPSQGNVIVGPDGQPITN